MFKEGTKVVATKGVFEGICGIVYEGYTGDEFPVMVGLEYTDRIQEAIVLFEEDELEETSVNFQIANTELLRLTMKNREDIGKILVV